MTPEELRELAQKCEECAYSMENQDLMRGSPEEPLAAMAIDWAGLFALLGPLLIQLLQRLLTVVPK